MPYPELYVLRHGETHWNAEKRMQGRLDSPLTKTGEAQAARQGEILQQAAPPNAPVFSSPQGRALRTAEIICGPDRPVLTDARLSEIDVGRWQGQLRSSLQIKGPLQETSDGPLALYEQAEGGEGFAALRRRCTSFLDDLEEVTGPVILVTHGITSRMLRLVWLGWPTQRMADLPGGQGIVHHLKAGQARVLD